MRVVGLARPRRRARAALAIPAEHGRAVRRVDDFAQVVRARSTLARLIHEPHAEHAKRLEGPVELAQVDRARRVREPGAIARSAGTVGADLELIGAQVIAHAARDMPRIADDPERHAALRPPVGLQLEQRCGRECHPCPFVVLVAAAVAATCCRAVRVAVSSPVRNWIPAPTKPAITTFVLSSSGRSTSAAPPASTTIAMTVYVYSAFIVS